MMAMNPPDRPTGRPGRTRGAASGFTLIEMLIALVILSTGIVIVLQAFQTSAKALGEARDAMRATHLMQRTLQEHERVPGMAPTPVGGGVCPDPFDDFSWTADRARADAGVDGLSQLRIEVWRSNSRVRYAVSTYHWDGGTEGGTP